MDNKLKNSAVFKKRLEIVNTMTSTSMVSTPMSIYQNKIYDYSLSDLFLLNYKKSISNYDFSVGLNESSRATAVDSFKFNLEMKSQSGGSGIKLPMPKKIHSKLSAILQERKTLRQFAVGTLNLVDFSTLLHYVLRVKQSNESRQISRVYSSGGGCYPISFYFYSKNIQGIEKGLYEYEPFSHTVSLISEAAIKEELLVDLANVDKENLSFLGFFVYDKRKSFLKYGDLALPMAWIEVGSISQTFFLVANALSIGVCELGGFEKVVCEKKLNIDGINLHVIGCIAFGREH